VQRNIINARKWFLFDRLTRNFDQTLAVTLSIIVSLVRLEQRAMQNRGSPMFLIGQVDIARRHRQAGFFAHNRRDDYLRSKGQISDQLLNDNRLLSILLSEEDKIRFDYIQQYGDHRSHAAEMTRSCGTLQFIGKPFDRYVSRETRWVHLFDCRCENIIDVVFSQQSRVAGQIAWIGLEVFRGPKLSGIHED